MSRVSQTSLLLPAAVAVAGLLASIPYIVQLRRRLESCEKKLSAAEQSLDEAAESTAKTEALATEALKDLASEVATLSSEPAPAPAPTEPLMTEVAHVASCYSHICVTPRNSFLVPKARSEIRFAKTIPAEALDGLEENSHCWVLFQFHRNNNGHKLASGKTFRAKVRVPRNNAVQGDGKTGRKVGCFATRTPHRPNNLGLTLARIKSVDLSRRTVVLSGSDLLDGTPVYDVKPYVPCYDSPAVLDPETPLR
jgi:tRNA-Thr(GGU) m(6)t(6)A37 methyltransferase TsaA